MSPRTLKIAAAQLGPIHSNSTRPETLSRLLSLLNSASSQGAKLVLFPETALTTFFPRHLLPPGPALDAFFEHGDITASEHTKPLFDRASAERGEAIAKYRKVHLPGTVEPFEDPNATNQLEKRYFTPGDLDFEAFRAPGLVPGAVKKTSECRGAAIGDGQGVEIILRGYNTAGHAPELWGTRRPMTPEEAEEDALFHHRLVMQANSYMNSCFSVCAAKAGLEDGKYDLIGGSCIVSPEGRIVAESKGKDDEVVVAELDLGECRQGREKIFDFGRRRRVEHYGRILEQTGVREPELL